MSKPRKHPNPYTITAINGNDLTVQFFVATGRTAELIRTVSNANSLAIGMKGYFSGRSGQDEFVQLIN